MIECFGEVIRQVNGRFDSRFNLFPDQDVQAKAAVFEKIDKRNRLLDKGKVTHLYRPDKDKDILKNAVELQQNSELYQKALTVYNKYISLAERQTVPVNL